jgi:hypothetical protein
MVASGINTFVAGNAVNVTAERLQMRLRRFM